jgi:enamine deaminase RidA (YjgF/YER057c/UK114 family)
MKRRNFSSGAKWEDTVGYSRVVRIGNNIEVSGTTAMNGNVLVAENDAYGQTKFILSKIQSALELAGASMEDVIRTRMFVTDISRWEEIGKAHREFFKNTRPATTVVEVRALIDARMLIEIEASAIIA